MMLWWLFSQLLMQPGEARVIEVGSDVVQMAVGDGEVVDSRSLGNGQVVVMALQPGFSQLLLWHDDELTQHDIHVLSPSAVGLQNFLETLQTEETELNITKAGDLTIVSGQVSADSQRTLFQLAERFPQLVISFQEEPRVAARLIELEVRLVEFKRRHLRNLGVRWQQVTEGPVVGVFAESSTSTRYAYAGIAAELSSRIQLLEEQGEARMLASPVLRTESGSTAHFHAGGEVPLPQTNVQGAMEVEFRSYGIRLSIAPEFLHDGSIRTSVMTEVSNLDPAVTIAGLPGLLTRRAESVVALPPGRTFVISGLISEESSQNKGGMPPLGIIPGLDKLMGSSEQHSSETELVLFITPRLVNDEMKRQKERMEAVERIQQQLTEQSCRGMRSYL